MSNSMSLIVNWLNNQDLTEHIGFSVSFDSYMERGGSEAIPAIFIHISLYTTPKENIKIKADMFDTPILRIFHAQLSDLFTIIAPKGFLNETIDRLAVILGLMEEHSEVNTTTRKIEL